MNVKTHWILTLATLGGALSFAGQATARTQEAKFAAPVRIMAGDSFLGEGRLYPSPVVHDFDGDGHADIVIGDLFGRVTVASGDPSRPMTFAAEKKVKGKDGELLNFHNW